MVTGMIQEINDAGQEGEAAGGMSLKRQEGDVIYCTNAGKYHSTLGPQGSWSLPSHILSLCSSFCLSHFRDTLSSSFNESPTELFLSLCLGGPLLGKGWGTLPSLRHL